jgi:hypothetical protein
LNVVKIAAVLLIAAGTLGLVYGSFSYTRKTHEARLGPVEFSLQEKERVSIPAWAGVGSIAIGSLLLLVGGRKR